jgi:hypothetical protein
MSLPTAMPMTVGRPRHEHRDAETSDASRPGPRGLGPQDDTSHAPTVPTSVPPPAPIATCLPIVLTRARARTTAPVMATIVTPMAAIAACGDQTRRRALRRNGGRRSPRCGDPGHEQQPEAQAGRPRAADATDRPPPGPHGQSGTAGTRKKTSAAMPCVT